MPTIIALDISLSMAYTPPDFGTTPGIHHSRLHLSLHGIRVLLEYLAAHRKLENVALITYSSKAELVVPFTRDYELIEQKLSTIDVIDKTDHTNLVKLINLAVTGEWGSQTPCQVFVFTDGSSSLDANSTEVPVQQSNVGGLSFPATVTVVSVSPVDDFYSPHATQTIINTFNCDGKSLKTDVDPSVEDMSSFIGDMCTESYSSGNTELKCGNILSKIQLFPTPTPFTTTSAFETTTYRLDSCIEICGFLDMKHMSTAPAVSHHLVVALSDDSDAVSSFMDEDEEASDEDTREEVSSFCVLLHASLKEENMVAVCQVGPNWYGVLYSWTDPKKRSNLMLNLLEPHKVCVPWIGDFNQLGISTDDDETLDKKDEQFPLRPSEKRSYNQNIIQWLTQTSLQSDIQKIIRQARRIPEKSINFYKELNKLKKAAISFGFVELLHGLANILERECTQLPESSHPECTIHLSHAAALLKSPNATDPNFLLAPFKS